MLYFPRVRFENQADIWELFHDLPDISKEVSTLEIIRSAKRGTIGLDDSFTLKGYSSRIRARDMLAEIERAKVHIPLLPNPADSDSNSRDWGVTEDSVSYSSAPTSKPMSPGNYSDIFESQILQSEIQILTKKFEPEGYNLEIILKNSSKNHKGAMASLKDIVKKHPEIRTVVLEYLRETL